MFVVMAFYMMDAPRPVINNSDALPVFNSDPCHEGWKQYVAKYSSLRETDDHGNSIAVLDTAAKTVFDAMSALYVH
jgi:hypothetical protein